MEILLAKTEAHALERLRPTDAEIHLARHSRDELRRIARTAGTSGVRLVSGNDPDDAVTLPSSALRLLASALDEMALGHEVVLSSVERELTTQEAADLLNVSRPHLVSMLERGEIAFRRVGNRRRVRYADVAAYRERMDEEAERAYAELVAQAQALGMGY
jgi:excisionase family DNA binding protein